MALGVGLVVAVLLLTLGLRAALIVAVILPVVSLASLATMNAIALPIHQMSVTGMIVALGLLVDAGIVMTDEVGRRLRAGVTRARAVADSVSRLTMPLFASTSTTALSFLPMILLPGPAGDFVGSIALAVVIMLGWSFVVAVAITPAIAGWLLPDGSGGRFCRWPALGNARPRIRGDAPLVGAETPCVPSRCRSCCRCLASRASAPHGPVLPRRRSRPVHHRGGHGARHCAR
jgi:multidrug efflux pump subunit AcrB